MMNRYLFLALEWLRSATDFSLLILAFFGGLYFFWRKAQEEHFELVESVDGIILAAIAGFLGARAWYVLFHLGEFINNWPAIFQIWSYPGLWSIGGLIFSFLVMQRVAQKQKVDTWEMWDFYSLFLTWYFTWYWLSRFVAGAAAGISTNLPWGILFPQRVEPAHPVQVYAAAGFALLFSYLFWVEPRYRFFFWYRSKKRTAKTGYLFSCFLIFFGLIGFLLSFVQYPFFMLFDFDMNQIAHGLIFLSGCVLLYVRSGRSFFSARESKKVTQGTT
jgi:phosphatidylglycerol:prolipoprotein diacylglycerol transferase